MLNELEKIKKEFLDSIETIKDSRTLEELRVKFLGSKRPRGYLISDCPTRYIQFYIGESRNHYRLMVHYFT